MGTVDRIIQRFLTASVERKREFRKSTDDLCITPAPLRSIPWRQENLVYVVDADRVRSCGHSEEPNPARCAPVLKVYLISESITWRIFDA